MDIGILVKEFPPNVIGGTETQTRRMAAELQRRTDHNVTVYTKAYSGEEQIDPEFDLVRIPNWRISPFISTLTFVLMAFLYLLRDRRQYDVLQCMMIYPNGFVGYLLHRFSGLPYFAWIRGGDYYFMKDTGWKRWMIERVLSDTLVLVQTEQIKRDVLSEFPDSNLQVLGNGVDIPEQVAEGEKIVFVGRLKEQKGVHILLQALRDIDEELLVVGDGPERERLESLAEDLGVTAEFVGWVEPDSVSEYLQQGKAFVLPSVTGEGLPNALLEAYAHGLPVVATDTGGTADAIIDGETGFVVDPGSVPDLADAIEKLCQDDEQRSSMGETARNYAEDHHSWDVIIEEFEDVHNKHKNDTLRT